ncbi:acetylxylan esterase [Cetobacterium ceti]
MPSVDMSLDKLKNYTGINPKPSDFEEFWANSIEESNNTPLNYSFKESSFTFPFGKAYDLTFKGIDGENIYAKALIPNNIEKPIGAIIEFHGYGGNSRDWSSKLPYVASGYAIFSMDCRDQMGYSGEENFRRGNIIRGIDKTPKDLYYRKTYLDGYRLSKILEELEYIDSKKICTLGLSQGGALAFAVGALNSNIHKIFSIYPFLSDFKRVWEMDLGEGPYEELKDYFRFKDPLHEKENEFFTTLGYIDIQNFASKINCEITMVTGLMDRICPPSTQFAAYNKIFSKKNMLVYPDFGHEDIFGLNDIIYKWILNI